MPIRDFGNRDVFYSNFRSSKSAEIYKVIYPVIDKEINLSNVCIVDNRPRSAGASLARQVSRSSVSTGLCISLYAKAE